jgi:hypothetical protein
MLYSPPYAFRYEAPLVVAYYDSTGTRASMCSLYFGDRLMSVQAPKTLEPVPLQRPGRSAASKEPAWWSPSCDDLLRDWRGAARITQDLSGRSPARISGSTPEVNNPSTAVIAQKIGDPLVQADRAASLLDVLPPSCLAALVDDQRTA